MASDDSGGPARRKRLQVLGGVVVLVAVIVLVLAVSGGGKKAEVPPPTSPEPAFAPVRGIPESGNVLGEPTAPVTLEFFGDLQSSTCREFVLAALPYLIHKWVRSGDLRIEYHSLKGKEATRSPETFKKQQVAAYAAGAQNKAWYFIETFYHEQGEEDSGYVTESFITAIARQVPGMDLAEWKRERANPRFVAGIEKDADMAHRAGFNETPSFLIGRTAGAMKKLERYSPLEPTSFNEAIKRLLMEG